MWNKVRKERTNRIKIVSLLLVVMLLATACGEAGNGTKVVLTTGFKKDEVFRIETASCSLPEIMVYLTNTQNQYESVYGKEIWEADLEGETLEENVKETVLARIAQVKSMNLLAESRGVALSLDEQEAAAKAAERYYTSLSDKEVELLGITQEMLQSMYQEYALAQKVYQQIIHDINPEISDDEARTIVVQHILIKTYTTDGTGKRVEYTEHAKAQAYEKAQEILALALEGKQEFEALISKYSEDPIARYSFGKGEMDPDFEAAAFDLAGGEISQVVESEFGYHIIKCISTFDREETDLNKIKIVEQRRKEVFGLEYDAFVDKLTRKLNDELWQQVTFLHDPQVDTKDFFDVYEEYF
ncbi:MAG: peptidylprolyl isomerase [Lachnospiraceae bacterium]|nr:peptidylprolyl isomerase [Lachnospiraceae bacterium]